MNYVTLSNQPEKNFTTKVKNDIIKEKAKTIVFGFARKDKNYSPL